MEHLRVIELEHLSQVNIWALLDSFVPGNLEKLVISDINWAGRKNMDDLIAKIKSAPKLTHLGLNHFPTENQSLLPLIATTLAENQEYSLETLDLSKNLISVDQLKRILKSLSNLKSLKLIDLTTIKNIHEYSLEELILCLEELGSKRTIHVEIRFSEHFFEYFLKDPHTRTTALERINEACSPLRIFFHPVQSEEKPKDE